MAEPTTARTPSPPNSRPNSTADSKASSTANSTADSKASSTASTAGIPRLEFAQALGLDDRLAAGGDGLRFAELHHRVVDRPLDAVWPHCLAVAARDVRTLGPLMALRSLPARLRGGQGPLEADDAPLLDVFTEAEFVMLRRDDEPCEGRAVVIFGGAGRFWSPIGNGPIEFNSPADFIEFRDPGYAKTVCRLEATDLGDGTTRLETETVVAGTDRSADRRFAPYWALIRLPSGLIRRSWLAAIARLATGAAIQAPAS